MKLNNYNVVRACRYWYAFLFFYAAIFSIKNKKENILREVFMNKFKKLIISGHTQRKEYLQKLYTDRQVYISSISSSMQPVEDEKIFNYNELSFSFQGTGLRTVEKMIIYVFVPQQLIILENMDNLQENTYLIPYEDFILRNISSHINELSAEYKNDKKSSREKPEFSAQEVNSIIQKRNGCIYIEEKKAFRIKIHFSAPLINEVNLNGKSAFRAVRAIIELIYERLKAIDTLKLQAHICLYKNQMTIRKYLKENNLTAFVGNGSIFPRDGESDAPMKNAIPFISPAPLQVKIKLSPDNIITGMGIPRGITVITGGAYSGKSTLLNAIEAGIYNHVSGDGREYVIADESACKIYAEDGRYINNTDLSPFFTYIPGSESIHSFHTPKASGSVSQAANIIEAIYGECRLLMIDEDTSAANFMIRDSNMQRLVKKEPIIPFTSRITELKQMGISTLLVIGGSGEYLRYADTVILMEDYIAKDKTEFVERNIKPMFDIDSVNNLPAYTDYCWIKKKSSEFKTPYNDFFFTECVQIENARYIKINDYTADITKITAIISDGQINSLTYLLERLLAKDDKTTELSVICKELVKNLFAGSIDTILSNSHKYELWLEDVRPVDLLMAVFRMRE